MASYAVAFSLVGFAWGAAKLGVQWHYNLEFETRREQEARLLVETLCDTVKGASLANEFAKCEQARIALRNTRLVWLKAFEKTLETTLAQILEISGRTSLATAWNFCACVVLICVVGIVCRYTTDFLRNGRSEMDLFSPVAQHRMLATSYVQLGDARTLEDKKVI